MSQVAADFFVYGIKIHIHETGEVTTTTWLLSDFESVLKKDPVLPAKLSSVNLHISQKKQWPIKKTRPIFESTKFGVWGIGRRRVVRYADGDWVYICRKNKRIQIGVFAASAERRYELAYLSLLSVIGEILENRGYVRMHALAYETPAGASSLLLPSGGGKSSLAVKILQSSGANLLGDEIILARGNQLLPFLLRLSLDKFSCERLFGEAQKGRRFQRLGGREKSLFKLNEIKSGGMKEYTKGTKVDRILWGNSGTQTNKLRRPGLGEYFSFLWSVLLGLGLPQMAEFYLRVDALPGIGKAAIRRIFWALKRFPRLRTLDINRDFDESLKILLHL